MPTEACGGQEVLRTVQGHLSLDSTHAGRRRLPWHVLLTCVVTVERTQINTDQRFRPRVHVLAFAHPVGFRPLMLFVLLPERRPHVRRPSSWRAQMSPGRARLLLPPRLLPVASTAWPFHAAAPTPRCSRELCRLRFRAGGLCGSLVGLASRLVRSGLQA